MKPSRLWAKPASFLFLQAVRILAVSQKRRIYDITNVLEGVGLIVKISKSVIQWMYVFNPALFI